MFQAANYLDIKGLLDVTCKTVANMIKGKTPEEIRKTFNIKNDFTPAEEEQVRTFSQTYISALNIFPINITQPSYYCLFFHRLYFSSMLIVLNINLFYGKNKVNLTQTTNKCVL